MITAMKKSLFLILLMLCAWSGVNAQGYMFVNSETVFKAQADYNEAITKLETKTTENQKKIDDTYAQIETMYNNYQAQKSYLSDMKRTAREEEIIALEREVRWESRLDNKNCTTTNTLVVRRFELAVAKLKHR